MVYRFQVAGTSQAPVTLAQIFIEEQLFFLLALGFRKVKFALTLQIL